MQDMIDDAMAYRECDNKPFQRVNQVKDTRHDRQYNAL